MHAPPLLFYGLVYSLCYSTRFVPFRCASGTVGPHDVATDGVVSSTETSSSERTVIHFPLRYHTYDIFPAIVCGECSIADPMGGHGTRRIRNYKYVYLLH